MTEIIRCEIHHVALRLKKKIKHASHDRATSDSVIVSVRLATGEVGYGEGVPREYVTGETVESAMSAIESWNLAKIAGKPASYAEIVQRLSKWEPEAIVPDSRKINVNAARCAVEIAILDAYARHFGLPLGETIRLADSASQIQQGPALPVRYSGAITAETSWKEKVSAVKMRVWGFRQVKIKVGVTGQDDVARLSRIRRRLGKNCDIRLDANEAWSPDEFVRMANLLAFSNPSTFEQPVAHEVIEDLAKPEYHVPFPVILDESLCGMLDAERSIHRGFGEIFNIRLSKCGGILPSLKLIAKATQSGKRYGLGCHPGESPILSAAGRAFASHVRNLVFLEGSYDRHVLAEHFATPDITFGYGGKAKPIDRPGLGITIHTGKLEEMTLKKTVQTYD
ncbi:MAG: hypothetical protein RJA81_1220 [Planctomycetota bacterium]